MRPCMRLVQRHGCCMLLHASPFNWCPIPSPGLPSGVLPPLWLPPPPPPLPQDACVKEKDSEIIRLKHAVRVERAKAPGARLTMEQVEQLLAGHQVGGQPGRMSDLAACAYTHARAHIDTCARTRIHTHTQLRPHTSTRMYACTYNLSLAVPRCRRSRCARCTRSRSRSWAWRRRRWRRCRPRRQRWPRWGAKAVSHQRRHMLQCT